MDVVDTRTGDPLWAEFNRRFNVLAARFGGRPLLNQTKHPNRALVAETLGVDSSTASSATSSERGLIPTRARTGTLTSPFGRGREASGAVLSVKLSRTSAHLTSRPVGCCSTQPTTRRMSW